MRKLSYLVLIVSLLLPVVAPAQTNPAPAKPTRTAEVPPIIDRELFFGDPEITGAQLSPDGTYMSFIKPYRGTRNIWVKKRDEPFTAAKPMTADTTRPVRSYFWSRDSKYLLFTQDKGGDENYNVYAVNPADAPQAALGVPAARNLTDLKDVRAIIYKIPKTDPAILYIGLNDRDKAWHDLYTINIATGQKKLLRQNTDRLGEWVFDWNDKLRLATRSAEDGSTELLRVDEGGKFTKIYSTTVFENSYPVAFHKDNRRFYLVTNKGDLDLAQLMLMDPMTLKTEFVETDPLKRVDFGELKLSEVSHEPIFTTYNDDRLRRVWKDNSYQQDFDLIQKQIPGADIFPGSSTDDERFWIVSAFKDTDPGAAYLFDRQTKKLTFQYRPRPKIPVGDLAEMTIVRYKSSDGLEIPAYLTLPKGRSESRTSDGSADPKNLPVVVFPHGGPWARDSWGYNSFHQFWANRGYAVLSPNFRVSTGYGKKFFNAGKHEWGQKMQDDITWGVKYLISRGIADPKRIGIMGGSYGGYATLAGVTFTPDLYAAAIPYVAPSNLVTLINSFPAYWAGGMKHWHEYVGNPTNAEDKTRLEKQSPLFYVDRIKTPLLIVHGANDPRVKKFESDQIVVALRERSLPVEYIVAPDEGHGFAKPINNMAMLASAEKFFAKHLGGRYQESMPHNVAKRLKEITVDPKTVTLVTK